MSLAYRPYAPLLSLKPIVDGLWVVDGGEVSMSFAGVGLPFPTRMTVVRLHDGAVWVHSPIKADENLFAAIEELGPVAHIVAPNNLHYSFVTDWYARFPKAQLYFAPGLEKHGLPAGRTLAHEVEPAWNEEMRQLAYRGLVLKEIAFFHIPTRSLILTDLIEDFEADRAHSRLLRWFMKLIGPAGKQGKAPIDMRLNFLGYRKELRQAAEQLIKWGPERVIFSHGRWYEDNAAPKLRRALRWIVPENETL